jgi:hypothetical protein
MKKPYPALCRDCKWGKLDTDSKFLPVICTHPVVNANDPWALTYSGAPGGSSARDERSKVGLFARCGIKGKLWEAK